MYSKIKQFFPINTVGPSHQSLPLLSGQISDTLRYQNTTKLFPSIENTPLISHISIAEGVAL